jgi:glutathione synthase/RimK-type ligase-like ATP-grasp enzyme
MRKIVVATDTADWDLDTPGVTVVSAREYLTGGAGQGGGPTRVFNLCRDLRYQSNGYYVSLLAEARGHKPVPSVSTLQDLRSPTVLRHLTSDLDELVQSSLAHLKSEDFTLSIYFGRNVAKHYDVLAKRLATLVDAPLLRARFTRTREKWVLASLRLVPASAIPDDHRELATEFARAYFGGRRRSPRPSAHRYDLAVLVNPDEPAPPSDAAALDRFARAAARLGFDTDFITRDDFPHLLEFDALFIRATTAVNHHTYRFAARAAREGMPVIDDPASILRCTNKVFLAELFARHKVASPPTVIVHRGNRREIASRIPFPVVLKQPDGAFSQGVVKAHDDAELQAALDRFLAKSDLAVAQAFTPSGFDWRIGVLDRRPLFACKYFMAPGHWQIYDWGSEAADPSGESEPVPVHLVPPAVASAALKAANLMGDGFYGVDLKETASGEALVIEVNDNPSVDAGVEDALLGDALYDAVVGSLKARLDRRGAAVG